MSDSKARITIGILGTASGFIASSLLSPFFGKIGEKFANKWLDQSSITIETCSPLRDARTIIKKVVDNKQVIIADQIIERLNSTSVLVKNETGKTLKNGQLTIYPLSRTGKSPPVMFTQMAASSIVGSKSYKVDKKESSYTIEIPTFQKNDFILVNTAFLEPVGYVVEMYSDDESKKIAVEPGCKKGYRIDLPPIEHFYSFVSDRCSLPNVTTDKIECKNENVVPFMITPDMLGKEIMIQDRIIE